MDIVGSVVVLAQRLGLHVEEAVVLRSTNNEVVWLRPSMVVAKISSRPRVAADELAIATTLAAAGAPVVPPARDVADRVHRVAGRDVTFWKYEPQDQIEGADSESIAIALHDLHGALAMLGSVISLPTCDTQIVDAIYSLDNQDLVPELRITNRTLLRHALSSGRETLAELHETYRVVHGSPHRMNILVVAGGPRFVGFETVQLAPLEWDLAHLEPAVADHYPARFDASVLAVCRIMISAATSTWCWAGLQRGSDIRSHAEHHLAVVRSALG
jgi:hypothetical protein